MKIELSNLLHRFNDPELEAANVISWSSPVLSFGNLSTSKLATVGLNPSNREFVDTQGNELAGTARRFHTLKSLSLRHWADAAQHDLEAIIKFCEEYFLRNPYDGWFKQLDYIISGSSFSYYFPSAQACHVDLIPYATSSKWMELTTTQRLSLLEHSGDTLGLLIKDSPVEVLILNGRTVVENMERITNVQFEKTHMPQWTLPRKNGDGIVGIAYQGFINSIGGVPLSQELLVLGYNHNIQSSYGVTTEVKTAIRNWISESTMEVLNETR